MQALISLIMQVGMMATSHTMLLLPPLQLPAQVLHCLILLLCFMAVLCVLAFPQPFGWFVMLLCMGVSVSHCGNITSQLLHTAHRTWCTTFSVKLNDHSALLTTFDVDPDLQMILTMAMVGTTTMTTSVATMVMSMATTTALVDLHLLQQQLLAKSRGCCTFLQLPMMQ
jgi:hypothetical protein